MFKNILYFTKKEKKQFLKLIFYMVIIIILNQSISKNTVFELKEMKIQIVKKEKTIPTKQSTVKSTNKIKIETKLRLHSFDPNTVDKSELESMHLPKKGIKSLLNYRGKGGHIKNVRDFKRMYGFEQLEDSLLHRYLLFPNQIEEKILEASQFIDSKSKLDTAMKKVFSYDTSQYKSRFKANYPFKKKKDVPLEKLHIGINTADTIQLQKLKGIGPFRAKMIVSFREALGGYHSIDQLHEVHYLPDSIIHQLRDQLYLDSIPIKKIKLNIAEQKELAAHPYLDWQEAKMLYNFTKEHGPITQTNELFHSRGLDTLLILRIEPYLDLTE